VMVLGLKTGLTLVCALDALVSLII